MDHTTLIPCRRNNDTATRRFAEHFRRPTCSPGGNTMALIRPAFFLGGSRLLAANPRPARSPLSAVSSQQPPGLTSAARGCSIPSVCTGNRHRGVAYVVEISRTRVYTAWESQCAAAWFVRLDSGISRPPGYGALAKTTASRETAASVQPRRRQCVQPPCQVRGKVLFLHAPALVSTAGRFFHHYP